MSAELLDPAVQSGGRVVVGVDGSRASQAALAWAARYASKFQLELEAIMTWHLGTMHGYPLPDVDDVAKSKAKKALHESIVEVLGEDSGVVETVLRRPAALALLKAAESASLLVLGTRGRGAFSGMLLGSVSQHCVQQARCPVVVIPPPPDEG